MSSMHGSTEVEREDRQGSPAAKAVFQVFIVTGEQLDKIQPVTDTLAQSNCCFLVDVLTGAKLTGDRDRLGPHVRVWEYPGESVFHLRSRIPDHTDDAEWIVILEDHNHVTPDWPDRLCRALSTVASDCCVVIGAATNELSTDAWSTANFLSVLGFHWAPEIHEPLEPVGFNIAFRRNRLPDKRFTLGEYETSFVPELMKSASASADFPVDHVQYRRFPEVLIYHWANGRATGAFMRDFTDAGLRTVFRHAINTTIHRQHRLRGILRRHPRRSALPHGTPLRMQVLAMAHSLGALHGAFFGIGKAPWALE